MQRDVVEVVFGPGLDHLLEIIDGHRLGGEADHAIRVGGLGGVVGGDHDIRIVRRRLVGPVPFGGSFQTSKYLDRPLTCFATSETYSDQPGRLFTGSPPRLSCLFHLGFHARMPPKAMCCSSR